MTKTKQPNILLIGFYHLKIPGQWVEAKRGEWLHKTIYFLGRGGGGCLTDENRIASHTTKTKEQEKKRKKKKGGEKEKKKET